jgi:4-amino-4-deoxy-L-arabinose transferase-like glycosyltransferase
MDAPLFVVRSYVRDPTHQPAADPTNEPADLTGRQFALGLLLIIGLAIVLRALFPLADPPWNGTVGIVWHDEGAWTHNARNLALFGAWRTDAWNPMFLAPVFTAFVALSFKLFGVGLWQARLVSEVLGVASVLLIAGTVRAAASRRTALVAAALLAIDYEWVMWTRAALLEATMVSLLVASACAYVHAGRRAAWGAVAGALAVAAFFAKASAAFFVGAIVLDSLMMAFPQAGLAAPADAARARRAALWTAAGLAGAGVVALVCFVLPNWHEFRFYNWQMTVVRKPSYSLKALSDRAAWLPVVHDFFTRGWMVTVLAIGGLCSTVAGWRRSGSPARLFSLWIVICVAELLAHDVGNERRLVLLIPPLTGLAAITLTEHRRLLSPVFASLSRARATWLMPIAAYLLYVMAGGLARLAFLYKVRPEVYLSAAIALLLTVLLWAAWPRVTAWLSGPRWSVAAALVLTGVVAAGGLAQYGQWLLTVSSRNYEAMVEVGRMLPAGTVVHGKLSNGLGLESRIHPVFVGHEFGNYADRLQRDDIRYLMTYRRPEPAYEGEVIREVIALYDWKVVRTFRVRESFSGDDEAVLLEKLGRKAAGR